jgi:hypothetical protein
MANTFELIASYTVGSGGAANIDFTSIPGTFTDLCILTSNRTDAAVVGKTLEMTFNNSTSSRTSRRLIGSGTAATSASFTNLFAGGMPGSSATASTFGNNLIYIPNYAGAANKSYSADGVNENNATEGYQVFYAGLWSDTAAITSIQLFPASPGNFVQYTTAYLYGVKNA